MLRRWRPSPPLLHDDVAGRAAPGRGVIRRRPQPCRRDVADAARGGTRPDRPNPYGARDRLRGRLHQELMYETVPAVLRPEDRNSMAFGIESRSPFLDYRLVELAFALPGRFKIRDGLGKWAIREGMRGTLEESVRTRHDKQGLVAPHRPLVPGGKP